MMYRINPDFSRPQRKKQPQKSTKTQNKVKGHRGHREHREKLVNCLIGE
jgi:hypothetical protein